MSARVGRPPVGPQVQVRLPAPLIAALDAEADRRGITRAALVRLALTEWITRT